MDTDVSQETLKEKEFEERERKSSLTVEVGSAEGKDAKDGEQGCSQVETGEVHSAGAGEKRVMEKSASKATKKKNISVRKRFTHKKRHKPLLKTVPRAESESLDVDEVQSPAVSNADAGSGNMSGVAGTHSASGEENYAKSLLGAECEPLHINIPDVSDDISIDISDLSSSLFSPTSSASSTCGTPLPPLDSSDVTSIASSDTPEPTFQDLSVEVNHDTMRVLLQDVKSKCSFMLPEMFVPIIDNGGIHVLMVGRRESKAVQREVFVSTSGAVRILVHGRNYHPHKVLYGVLSQKHLCVESVGYFVDRIVQIINNLRLLEVCAGMDKIEFKEAWPPVDGGSAQTDIFKECRFRDTFRSHKCEMLVEIKNWRCKECKKLGPLLKRKMETIASVKPAHPKTNNRFMSEKQKTFKLQEQEKTIRKQRITIDRLQSRIEELISKEGVKVSRELSNDLINCLNSDNLSITHSLFLQQQVKAVQSKKSCGMRWHPALIRLALKIYLKSPNAYRELQESGFIKLPTSRTLFDYSHVTKIEQGIDSSVIKDFADRVAKEEKKRQHPQYHVLMADEIHISKNLVIQKSTGEVIGFKELDIVDQEIASLDAYLDDPEKTLEPELASKVLAYMVKGCSSKLKDVIASFPVINPSPKQMYAWTWAVIGALEKSGIKIIAFTCDGAPTNRAFINIHKPVTDTPNGLIFDTVNKYAPERKLYFFSDVPHLLKTIRNAFYNSRKGKKGVRCLRKGGQDIVWSSIIRLYLAKKDRTLRKSYKLNPQNVFIDSYSKMKVSLAAQVMSQTVAKDLTSQGWAGTSETVDFIQNTNDWFDLLNGAFSTQGDKKNNPKLNAYTLKDVEDFQKAVEGNRFEKLLDFLKYLKEWQEEVKNRMEVSVMQGLGVQPIGDDSFEALAEDSLHEDQDRETENFSKRLLPHQTLHGIEMSTRSFIAAVTFLLNTGVPFINARVFCQDPLEQNFGKQRMGGGGSSAPNVAQFYHKQRAIHTIGQLGSSKKRPGNTEVLEEEAQISSEPLPKRKKTNKDSI